MPYLTELKVLNKFEPNKTLTLSRLPSFRFFTFLGARVTFPKAIPSSQLKMQSVNQFLVKIIGLEFYPECKLVSMESEQSFT